MDLSVKVSSEYYCGSYKVYLNFWVTDFGGCDRVQIKANISVFGWGCPSPFTADRGGYNMYTYVLAIL